MDKVEIPILKIEFPERDNKSIVSIKFSSSKQLSDFIGNNKRLFKSWMPIWRNIATISYEYTMYEVNKIIKIKQKEIIAEVSQITLRDRNLDIILN
jgi:hypothetical protein